MSTIGIDLGTTNTVVAMVYDDGPQVVPRGEPRLIPSVVGFEKRTVGTPTVVGEAAARMEAGEGLAAVRSIKRLMGRTYDAAVEEGSEDFFLSERTGRLVKALGGDLQVAVNAGWPEAKRFWPAEISAHVLREAKAHAERCLKRKVEAAAITVAAYFRHPHACPAEVSWATCSTSPARPRSRSRAWSASAWTSRSSSSTGAAARST